MTFKGGISYFVSPGISTGLISFLRIDVVISRLNNKIRPKKVHDWAAVFPIEPHFYDSGHFPGSAQYQR